MDNFLSCWISNTLAFVAVILFLNVFLCDATGLQCDLLTQNPVESEDGIILGCLKCRPCNPGFETYPPCGTTVGLNDPVGFCHVCKSGFYSIYKDASPCQPCRSSKCGDHEIPGGTCLKDQPDQSYCTGRCGKGYSMNSKRLCELDQPAVPSQKSAVPSQKSAVPSQKSAHLSDGKIVAIALVLFILVCIGLCFLYYKRKCGAARRHKGTKKDCEEGDAASMALINGTKDKNVSCSIVKQEEDCQNGLLSSKTYICTETSGGKEATKKDYENGQVDNTSCASLLKTKDEKNLNSIIKQEECQQNGLPTSNTYIGAETRVVNDETQQSNNGENYVSV